MLKSLTIDNFTIIDHLDINLKPGLSTLTGETGAGKSIIIDAIAQIAGAKSKRELIREGSDKATIFAEFSQIPVDNLQSILSANYIDFDREYLSIQKEIKKNGRAVSRINGSVVNSSILKEVGQILFNIEEQSKHQQLLEMSYQAELLDDFAGSSISPRLKEYQEKYSILQGLLVKRSAIEKKNRDLKERLDYLKFAVQEISVINPKEDEEKELEAKKVQLSNFEKINDHLNQIQNLIAGENSIQDLIGQAQQLSSEISSYNGDYQKIAESLDSASFAIDDALSLVSEASDELDLNNEGELNMVIERLNSIESLKKKYGDDLAEVLSYQRKAIEEINFAENSEQSLKDYDEKIDQLSEKVHKLADQLTIKRKDAAKKLEPLIEKELTALDFKHAKFKINFKIVDPFEKGQDEITFLIQTNLGEKLLPLSDIASGGELSRILLALKSIFATYFKQVTFIFDEIDSGVSGHAAQAMADKIYQIARSNQVISITHLPQLAAMSDQQYLIEKHVIEDRTVSSVHLLAETEQVDEIAKMLTGTKMTEVTRIHAKEMIDLARKAKGKGNGGN